MWGEAPHSAISVWLQISKTYLFSVSIKTVKTENMDQITKTESGENIYYIAKINFNGQEYTGKFIHDNANEKDVPFVAGSVFGNGSVLVLIIMFFLAVFTTIAVIAAKKKKKI